MDSWTLYDSFAVKCQVIKCFLKSFMVDSCALVMDSTWKVELLNKGWHLPYKPNIAFNNSWLSCCLFPRRPAVTVLQSEVKHLFLLLCFIENSARKSISHFKKQSRNYSLMLHFPWLLYAVWYLHRVTGAE